jgi:hypothetical protein
MLASLAAPGVTSGCDVDSVGDDVPSPGHLAVMSTVLIVIPRLARRGCDVGSVVVAPADYDTILRAQKILAVSWLFRQGGTLADPPG